MSTNGGPETIYIIRHGEKLGDPTSDTDDGPDLSIQGSARAAALPELFVPPTPEWSCALAVSHEGFTASYKAYTLKEKSPRFQTPDFIFATKASTASNRPVETITPLSATLNLTYSATCGDSDYAALATKITSDPTYTGKIVLICWHHGTIPDLAAEFGVANPPSWKGTVFDRVWEIKYNPGPATFKNHAQRLLYGDSAS